MASANAGPGQSVSHNVQVVNGQTLVNSYSKVRQLPLMTGLQHVMVELVHHVLATAGFHPSACMNSKRVSPMRNGH